MDRRASTTRTRTPRRSSDDGWLRTGDVARDRRATGYIRITDRAKDVIKSGGEWISSVELENELMAHPAVAEAAVIARARTSAGPSARSPASCSAEGQDVTPEELREHLAAGWPSGGCPTTFAFIDEVPKTSVGKFDKKVAAQVARGGRARGPSANPNRLPIGMSRASRLIFRFGTRTQPWEGRPGISPARPCRGCR